MSLTLRLVIAFFRTLTSVLCRIDDDQLEQVPAQGPLIIVINHINLLEIPVLFTRLQPRPLTGFVAAYRWKNPLLRWLLNLCGAIPVRRGEADLDAMRRAIAALKAGDILVMAPEGTRSEDGRLQQGHPGVVLLALRSGVPLLPVAFHGSENFSDNLRHLRRTDFHFVVGRPFRLRSSEVRINRKIRREMTDEVMRQLAMLLPPPYRGVYKDLSPSDRTYLNFQSPSEIDTAVEVNPPLIQ
jgi:1-acyl-sn-glycerol-3-phosphate acyltransferase